MKLHNQNQKKNQNQREHPTVLFHLQDQFLLAFVNPFELLIKDSDLPSLRQADDTAAAWLAKDCCVDYFVAKKEKIRKQNKNQKNRKNNNKNQKNQKTTKKEKVERRKQWIA